jgi:hypothetical protein
MSLQKVGASNTTIVVNGVEEYSAEQSEDTVYEVTLSSGLSGGASGTYSGSGSKTIEVIDLGSIGAQEMVVDYDLYAPGVGGSTFGNTKAKIRSNNGGIAGVNSGVYDDPRSTSGSAEVTARRIYIELQGSDYMSGTLEGSASVVIKAQSVSVSANTQ